MADQATVSPLLTRLPLPGSYARNWKTIKSLPPDTLVSVPGWIVGRDADWGGHARTVVAAGLVLSHLRGALQRRINERGGLQVPPHDDRWYCFQRDADRLKQIRTARVRHYQFETKHARRRFSHLLSRYDD